MNASSLKNSFKKLKTRDEIMTDATRVRAQYCVRAVCGRNNTLLIVSQSIWWREKAKKRSHARWSCQWSPQSVDAMQTQRENQMVLTIDPKHAHILPQNWYREKLCSLCCCLQGEGAGCPGCSYSSSIMLELKYAVCLTSAEMFSYNPFRPLNQPQCFVQRRRV